MANDPILPPSKSTALASWIFGSILLLFYMGVFVFASFELPEFKDKMLAIFSALLCALFAFFLVGSLNVTIQVKNQWIKLGIQSGGGAAAFVLIMWWWSNSSFASIRNTIRVQPASEIPQKKIIHQVPNNVISNQYGVPQKIIDILLKERDRRAAKLQDNNGFIDNNIIKYKYLESLLINRYDDIAKQAKALLAEGELEETEKLLKSLDKEQNNVLQKKIIESSSKDSTTPKRQPTHSKKLGSNRSSSNGDTIVNQKNINGSNIVNF